MQKQNCCTQVPAHFVWDIYFIPFYGKETPALKQAGHLHHPVPHNQTQTSARSRMDSYLFTFRARVSFKTRQTRWALWGTGGKTKGRMRLWKTRSPISKPHQMRWSGRTIGPGGPSGPGDPGRPCSPCKTSQFPQSHRS